MAIALYMDHNIPRAITDGLRLRGVDVVTAFEDEANELDDPDLLDRATELGRVLFTMDDDLLVEAAERQATNRPFAGVIYAHQLRISIGQCINDLEIVVGAGDDGDLMNEVLYLPL